MPVSARSLANLRPNRNGTKPKYNEAKKRRHVTVTNTGWVACQSKVKADFGISVSELLEQLGRGNLEIVKVK